MNPDPNATMKLDAYSGNLTAAHQVKSAPSITSKAPPTSPRMCNAQWQERPGIMLCRYFARYMEQM